MKKRILLVDDSLTVQKVVALTLDRNRYAVSYARSRTEAMKQVVDSPPDLLLVSDQVADIAVGSFPKEVEAWMGREQRVPPIFLITAQDIREFRHYAGVLRKPFSPQALQSIVADGVKGSEAPIAGLSERDFGATPEEFEDQRLQKIFNETFNDEANLVRETFKNEIAQEERTQVSSSSRENRAPAGQAADPRPSVQWDDRPSKRPAPQPSAGGTGGGTHSGAIEPAMEPLWGPMENQPPVGATRTNWEKPASEVLGAEDSMAFKAALESQVESKIRDQDLDEIVHRVLTKIVPPIVERLVQERLDKLLGEQEQFLELKP